MLTELQKRIVVEDGQGFFGFINGLKKRFDDHPTLSEQFKRGDAANADEIIYVLLQALQCHFATKRQSAQSNAAPEMTVADICSSYADEFSVLQIQSWFNNLEAEIARLLKLIAIANDAKNPASRNDIVNAITAEIDKQLIQRKDIFEMSKKFRETNRVRQFQMEAQIAVTQAAEQKASKLQSQLNKNEIASTHIMMQQLVYGQGGDEGSTSSASASTSDSPPRGTVQQSQQPSPSIQIQYTSLAQRGVAQPITYSQNQHAADPLSSHSATSSSASSSPDNSDDPSPIQLLTGMSGGLYQEKPMELPAGVMFIGRSRRYFAKPNTPQHHYNILIVDAEIPNSQKGKNGLAFGPGRALYDLAITNSQNPATQQAMTNIFGREVKFHYLAYNDFIKIDKSIAGKSVRNITKEVDFVFAYSLGQKLDCFILDKIDSYNAHKKEATALAIAFAIPQVLCQNRANSQQGNEQTELCFSEEKKDGRVKTEVFWRTTQRIVLNTDNQSAFFALLTATQAYARNEWASRENYASKRRYCVSEDMRDICTKLTYPSI